MKMEIFWAISIAFMNLVKGIIKYSSITPVLASLSIDNHNFLGNKCNNKIFRSLMTNQCFSLPVKRKILLPKFSKPYTVKIRNRYVSFPLFPKMKEIHFKTINDIYPCKESLRLRFSLIIILVLFCQEDIETQEHLFYSCNILRSFWDRKILFNSLKKWKIEVP